MLDPELSVVNIDEPERAEYPRIDPVRIHWQGLRITRKDFGVSSFNFWLIFPEKNSPVLLVPERPHDVCLRNPEEVVIDSPFVIFILILKMRTGIRNEVRFTKKMSYKRM